MAKVDEFIPGLPDVPEGLSDDLTQFLQAVKRRLEIMGNDTRDNVERKTPTVQDLIDAGVANADQIT